MGFRYITGICKDAKNTFHFMNNIFGGIQIMDELRNLLNAVVEQAAKDYMFALCKLHNSRYRGDKKSYEDKVQELERFFCGPDFNGYSTLDGRWLMKKIKQKVEENDYDLIKIRAYCSVYRNGD